MVYCVVPEDLAPKLYGTLARFYAGDKSIEVIVDGRALDRRGADRRRGDLRERIVERRRVRGPSGRRVAERRAVMVPAIVTPRLPRAARRYADRLSFVVRFEDSSRHPDDVAVARIALRIQGGDMLAFENAYKDYFDIVYGYLRLVLASVEDIEEAVQTVFARVYAGLAELDVSDLRFRRWLGTVLFTYSYAELGLAEADEDAPLPDRLVGVHDLAVLDWLTDHDLVVLIERLPPLQRQVVAMHYLLGLGGSEIADVVGRAPSEVERIHGTALRFMAGCLTSLGRRPGYSGRHPMRAHVEAGRVAERRQLALSR